MKNKKQPLYGFLKSIVLVLILVGSLLPQSIVDAATSSSTQTPEFVSNIGGGNLWHPMDSVVDITGNIYVSDSQCECVKILNSTGQLLQKWGRNGAADGLFSRPHSIALDSSNNVYVTDFNNNRVQKFDSNGHFITKWGQSGSGNGDLVNPSGIMVDSSGDVYVVDAGNGRVQKFTNNGAYVSQFGTYGNGDGEFTDPTDIARNSSGDIYVTDSGNSRVQKLTSSGSYMSQFGSSGSGNGEFSGLYGITISANDSIFITDTNNYRIQKFHANGAYDTKWGSYGSGNGEFNGLYGLGIDASNNIYATDYNNHRVQKFDSNGNYIVQFGSYMDDGVLSSPAGIALDHSSNLYIVDGGNNHRVQKFDSNGNYLSQFGSESSNCDNYVSTPPISPADNGKFCNPVGIAVGPSGDIYIVDGYNNRVQKFDSNGNYLSQFGSESSNCDNYVSTSPISPADNGKFCNPVGIAVGSSGDIYIVDGYNNRVQKFGSNGNYISQFGSESSNCDMNNPFSTLWPPGAGDDDKFCLPYGIDISPANKLYVSDLGNARIKKYDLNGNIISQFGLKSSNCQGYMTDPFNSPPSTPGDNGNFCAPTGVEVDSNNNVLAIDTFNSRVQQFKENGEFVTKWGAPGGSNGQLLVPTFIQSKNGYIYVSDGLSQRIQKFSYPQNLAELPQVNSSNKVNLTLPQGSNITNHAVVSSPKADGNLSYPLGLFDFTFNTPSSTPGATVPIELTFQTKLTPGEVVARKYNSSNQTYGDIPGAVVTQTTVEGQLALKLNYSITDGGPLDQDGTANGSIVDPVGLGTKGGVGAPNTGSLQQNILAPLSVFCVGIFTLSLRRYLTIKSHKP